MRSHLLSARASLVAVWAFVVGRALGYFADKLPCCRALRWWCSRSIRWLPLRRLRGLRRGCCGYSVHLRPLALTPSTSSSTSWRCCPGGLLFSFVVLVITGVLHPHRSVGLCCAIDSQVSPSTTSSSHIPFRAWRGATPYTYPFDIASLGPCILHVVRLGVRRLGASA